MLAFSWTYVPPDGYRATMFNLVLNGESVYSGESQSFAARGLDHSTCFEATVSAFLLPDPSARKAQKEGEAESGAWTPMSPALFAATASTDLPDISGLEQQAASQRQQLELVANQQQDLGDCSLAGLTDIRFDAASSSSLGVVFQGRSDASVRAGVLAARENCAEAVCQGESRDIGDPTPLLSGQLRLATGDPRAPVLLATFAQLPPHQGALRYTDPSQRGLLLQLPLAGCRARQGWPLPAGKGGRPLLDAELVALERGTGGPMPKSMSCIELLCGHRILPMVLCADSSADAGRWTARINEEAAGARLLERQEMAVHLSPAVQLRNNARRPANKGLYEQTGWRVAFISSFLGSLSASGAGDVFWRLYGVERCAELPDTMAPAPANDPTANSALPSGMEGEAVLQALARSVQDGAVESQYAVGLQGTAFGSDLGRALRQMGAAGDGAMSLRWARAVCF